MGLTKKFTILHSNDMHGDFLAEVKAGSGQLIGGLACHLIPTGKSR
jgi:5'-nucleotidase